MGARGDRHDGRDGEDMGSAGASQEGGKKRDGGLVCGRIQGGKHIRIFREVKEVENERRTQWCGSGRMWRMEGRQERAELVGREMGEGRTM